MGASAVSNTSRMILVCQYMVFESPCWVSWTSLACASWPTSSTPSVTIPSRAPPSLLVLASRWMSSAVRAGSFTRPRRCDVHPTFGTQMIPSPASNCV